MRSPIESLVEDFLAECRANGLSPKTIDSSYGYPLRRIFLPWCEAEQITEPRQLTTRTLTRFKAHLQEHGGRRGRLSPASVASYIDPLARLVAFGRREKEVSSEVVLKLPRVPEAVITTISWAEMEQMEHLAGSERDALMICLLRTTGIRAQELLSLTEEDLLAEDGRYYLIIRTRRQGGGAKGSRHRRVAIERQTFRRLEYLIRARPEDYTGQHIFIQERRRPGRQRDRLTVSGLLQIIKALARKAGIRTRVYTHLFRHSFATEMLRRKMDPLDLAKILGHSGLTMIWRHYGHLQDSDRHDVLIELIRQK